MKPIGQVTHFYNNLGVAVVNLNQGTLSVGDVVRFKHGNKEFEQTVDSLQVDHQSVPSIKAGEEAGLKVTEPVKEGWAVFKP